MYPLRALYAVSAIHSRLTPRPCQQRHFRTAATYSDALLRRPFCTHLRPSSSQRQYSFESCITVCWSLLSRICSVTAKDNIKPNTKLKRFLPSTVLGIYVKRQILRCLRKKGIYPAVYFGGILLFTNRVITHLGLNFLKISSDFADLGAGRM